MIFKDSKAYDIAKYIGRIFLPALLAFLLGLGKILGWDTGVIGSLGGIVITFYNTIMQIEYQNWLQSYNTIDLEEQEDE